MTDQAAISAALRRGGVIDITTTGRQTGRSRRIEIVFFNFDGHVYISGLPGRRGWLANLAADPTLTFHITSRPHADLPAKARIIDDAAERRPILERVCTVWNRQHQLEAFVARSPLIVVTFEDRAVLAA